MWTRIGKSVDGRLLRDPCIGNTKKNEQDNLLVLFCLLGCRLGFALRVLQTKRDAQPFHMVFQSELSAVFPEPSSAFLVFGHHGGHHVPEILGMVHMRQVTEFMDYYIIQDQRRGPR